MFLGLVVKNLEVLETSGSAVIDLFLAKNAEIYLFAFLFDSLEAENIIVPTLESLSGNYIAFRYF